MGLQKLEVFQPNGKLDKKRTFYVHFAKQVLIGSFTRMLYTTIDLQAPLGTKLLLICYLCQQSRKCFLTVSQLIHQSLLNQKCEQLITKNLYFPLKNKEIQNISCYCMHSKSRLTNQQTSHDILMFLKNFHKEIS